ncbi:DinB family protein [Ulvibacterium sp.]|uniref:DinB family protein n=1 Tax=Ulvibacterium sp. TaxID=2665914 RepID=UPI003CC598BB
METLQKPNPSEYPSYSSIYMDLLDDQKNILDQLWENFLEVKRFIYSLPEKKLKYRYAEGKWTIKEILVHNIDDERIFSCRAMRFARNDTTPLPGFEQDDYTIFSEANGRSLDSIFEEYEAVRKGTIALFKHLPKDSFMRKGSGIDTDGSIINERTVRAFAYHIAGHELRHLNIIKERYL